MTQQGERGEFEARLFGPLVIGGLLASSLYLAHNIGWIFGFAERAVAVAGAILAILGFGGFALYGRRRTSINLLLAWFFLTLTAGIGDGGTDAASRCLYCLHPSSPSSRRTTELVLLG